MKISDDQQANSWTKFTPEQAKSSTTWRNLSRFKEPAELPTSQIGLYLTIGSHT
ncbi:hypothetical protein [Trichocoleus sp. FACHB-262]|uniref:hypothetical protein n=1 Tax=Trichocoleus sp. FACHB-262 TaxID=2692869 RepID=UPI0016884937|nr:hypothetical protein [Trichocoleus sp. FACHB-262]